MRAELIARSLILFLIYPFTGFEKLVNYSTPRGARAIKPRTLDEITGSIDALFAFPGAARLFLRPVCFKKALLVYYFLKKHGHGCTIYFGVRKNGPGLEGHAWIETAGAPLHENPEGLKAFNVIYKR